MSFVDTRVNLKKKREGKERSWTQVASLNSGPKDCNIGATRKKHESELTFLEGGGRRRTRKRVFSLTKAKASSR